MNASSSNGSCTPLCPQLSCLNLILLDSWSIAYTMNFLFNDSVRYCQGDGFRLHPLCSRVRLARAPVFTYIAILRYQLYDIDRLINRTLVYGALTACVVGIYVLAVVGLGALFQARGNLGVSLLATGLVAVLFQPLRSRLQRGVNRLMYGERDDPYAVTSRLGTTPRSDPRPRGGAADGRRDDRPGAKAALRGHPAEGGRWLSECRGLRIAYGRTGSPAARVPEGGDRSPGDLRPGPRAKSSPLAIGACSRTSPARPRWPCTPSGSRPTCNALANGWSLHGKRRGGA